MTADIGSPGNNLSSIVSRHNSQAPWINIETTIGTSWIIFMFQWCMVMAVTVVVVAMASSATWKYPCTLLLSFKNSELNIKVCTRNSWIFKQYDWKKWFTANIKGQMCTYNHTRSRKLYAIFIKITRIMMDGFQERVATDKGCCYRPLSRRLDRCDRVIQDEVGDSNGGNV